LILSTVVYCLLAVAFSSSQLDLLAVWAGEDDPAPAVFARFAGGGVMRRA
jgi:hypothetical protein